MFYPRRSRAKAEKLLVVRCAALALALLTACHMHAQETPPNLSATPKPAAQVPWKISITVDSYILPDQDSYINPNVTADHGWLQLEARYNYENLRTGSVWFGYNFSAGKSWCSTLLPRSVALSGRPAPSRQLRGFAELQARHLIDFK